MNIVESISPEALGELFFNRVFAASEEQKLAAIEDAMSAAAKRFCLNENDDYFIRLCLDEALTNAVRHGCGADPSLSVDFRLYADGRKASFYVKDQGKGFDPRGIMALYEDQAQNESASGRGLVIMDGVLDELCFFDSGRGVLMVKSL